VSTDAADGVEGGDEPRQQDTQTPIAEGRALTRAGVDDSCAGLDWASRRGRRRRRRRVSRERREGGVGGPNFHGLRLSKGRPSLCCLLAPLPHTIHGQCNSRVAGGTNQQFCAPLWIFCPRVPLQGSFCLVKQVHIPLLSPLHLRNAAMI
jgi:hypothetical protein